MLAKYSKEQFTKINVHKKLRQKKLMIDKRDKQFP